VEERVEVAIVGAGPAGSTLAALLGRRGIAVALIDRDEFPRDKLCGEFLSYDALPILDRLGVSLDVPSISRCRVVSRRRVYEFDFPSAARGVSRLLLDDLLFHTAVAAGAQSLAGWTAIGLDPLIIERDGEQRAISARVIVGAWGRWGRFDSQLGRRFVRDRSHRSFGFKRHYTAAESDRRRTELIELYSFRGGYLGVSPIEGGLTNICGLVHASRLAGHKGRWDSFVETIRSEEKQLDAMYERHQPAQEGFLSSEPVIFRARSPIEQGVLMIGDASGIVDPLTGNGMAMAIQSALVAAPHVVRALEDRADDNTYRADHSAFFGPRIRWSRRVAAILSRPALLDAALHPVRSSRVGEFLLARTRASVDAAARLADEWF
jgi:flavin-dependent dehydrogenase